MILLTGATGTLGRPLLSRLTAAGLKVRCLVRDPRKLGAQRVHVQIAIGNLADRHGFAKAVRGVDTVIHLAAATRDQGRGSIERINGVATGRLIAAAERAGARRFVYVSALGANRHSPSRFIRTQALARDAVAAGRFESLIFETSVIYSPNDRWIDLLRGFSHLPLLPLPIRGDAGMQPIWADDAADAITAALLTDQEGPGAGVGRSDAATHSHYVELAGPRPLSHDDFVRLAIAATGRRRPLLHVPPAAARRMLRLQEWYLGPGALVTWDEAQLFAHGTVPARGAADVNALGVEPLPPEEVLSAFDV